MAHSRAVLAILDELGAPRNRRTTAELAGLPALAGRSPDKLRGTLTRMEAAGLLASCKGKWRSTPAGVAVAAAAGGHREQRQSLRQRLWTALRKLKKASLHDLLTLAASGAEKNARKNAQDYLRALTRAGYVVARARPGSRRAPAFILVRDSGPRAPLHSTGTRVVTDHHTGEVFHV